VIPEHPSISPAISDAVASEHVLAVVEHDQRVACPESVDDRFTRSEISLHPYRELGRDRRNESGLILDWR
jgi:hypothetical protein